MGERYVNRVGKTDTGPSVGKQPLFIRSKVGTESEGNIRASRGTKKVSES